MKKVLYILLPLISLLFPIFGSAQVAEQKDLPAILGQWRGEAGGSEIEIYKASESVFEAKVIWVKDPKQKKNEGVIFIKDMTYNAKKEAWVTDYLLSPEHNLVVKGELKVKEGVLFIKGRKFGISATEKFFRK